MPTNFLKAFFRLLIPLQPLGLLQRRIERLKRQLVVSKRANPFDGFHHGLIPKGRQMLRIDLFESKLPRPPLSGPADSTTHEIRRRLQSLPCLISPCNSLLRCVPQLKQHRFVDPRHASLSRQIFGVPPQHIGDEFDGDRWRLLQFLMKLGQRPLAPLQRRSRGLTEIAQRFHLFEEFDVHLEMAPLLGDLFGNLLGHAAHKFRNSI